MDFKKLDKIASDLVKAEVQKEKLEDRRKGAFALVLEAEDLNQGKQVAELRKRIASLDSDLELSRERIKKLNADMLKESKAQIENAIENIDQDLSKFETDFIDVEKQMCKRIGEAKVLALNLGHAGLAQKIGALLAGVAGYEVDSETFRLRSYLADGLESGRALVPETDWHQRKAELNQIVFLRKTPNVIVDHVKKLTMKALGRARRQAEGL